MMDSFQTNQTNQSFLPKQQKQNQVNNSSNLVKTQESKQQDLNKIREESYEQIQKEQSQCKLQQGINFDKILQIDQDQKIRNEIHKFMQWLKKIYLPQMLQSDESQIGDCQANQILEQYLQDEIYLTFNIQDDQNQIPNVSNQSSISSISITSDNDEQQDSLILNYPDIIDNVSKDDQEQSRSDDDSFDMNSQGGYNVCRHNYYYFKQADHGFRNLQAVY